MYIRKTKKTVKGRTYTNYVLVESLMTPKGPRQKTVFSLGNLKPRTREKWADLATELKDALTGQQHLGGFTTEVQDIISRGNNKREKSQRIPQDDMETVVVKTKGVQTEKVRQAGSIHAGHQFWNRLGLDEILAKTGLNEKSRILTQAMVLNRLICPLSEHAMPDWIRRTAMQDIIGFDFEQLNDEQLYRNMDKLYPARMDIEKDLAEREKTLFNLDDTIYLYDLTSTYFEGQALANPQAKHGYSRDGRPDCKQVVIGLVVDREGFPKAHEVFDGNRIDTTTVKEMLDVLVSRVGIVKGATVVVDRGMSSKGNLEEIKGRGLNYIVATRQAERNNWIAEFETEGAWEEIIRKPSPLNPFQKKSRVFVRQFTEEKETVVLCISEGRKEKDRAIRKKQEIRLKRDLEKLQLHVQSGQTKDADCINQRIGRLKERFPRVVRHYEINYDAQKGELNWQENAAKKAIVEKLDGGYILKTNRNDMNAEDIWRTYSLLTRAEQSFRAMKSPLAERPIFHQIEKRVQTHIFLCVLSYHLLVSIEKTLSDKGIYTSWGTLRGILETHQISTVVLPLVSGDILKIRRDSNPEKEHQEIYENLGIPVRIMTPVRTLIKTKNSD